MNTSEVTLGILFDYSKAFDTINHLTLLEKLQKLNFSVQALKLIHSYVSERKQFVQHDKYSSFKLHNFGVPQGSISGPVLFKLYIVDLLENVTCDSLWNTDDSILYKHLKPKNLKNMYWTSRIWSRNSITMVFKYQLSFQWW